MENTKIASSSPEIRSRDIQNAKQEVLHSVFF